MSSLELLRQLGCGSTGIVYQARDPRNLDIVALKRLFPDQRAPLSGIILASKILHRNVVRILDFFVDDDARLFVVMEYVDGENLAALLDRSSPLSVAHALRIAYQILDGLEAAHQERVVHRDLKPANILVAKDGTVKIVDFGLARTSDRKRTATIGVSGTLAYMAPEQLSGEKADERSDIYAFGLILREMLKGSSPPGHIHAAIARCLEFERAKRFQRVAEVRAALMDPLDKVFPLKRGSAAEGGRGSISSPAAQAFADARFFLDAGLHSDALKLFDRALKLEPAHLDARFYRALTLKKLGRLTAAIAGLKRILPRAPRVGRDAWNAEIRSNGGQQGLIADAPMFNLQRNALNHHWAAHPQRRLIAAERVGEKTVLQVIDFDRRSLKRLELPSDKINCNGKAVAIGGLSIVQTTNGSNGNGITLYAIDNQKAIQPWHKHLKDFGSPPPVIGAAGDLIYIGGADHRHFVAIDSRTGNTRWKRSTLAIQHFFPLEYRNTKSRGDVLIAKTHTAIRALRVSNGKDVWVHELDGRKCSHLAGGNAIAIFEPGQNVRIVELSTGKDRKPVEFAALTDNLPVVGLGSIIVASATIQRDTLYFQSISHELIAAPLGAGENGVSWHVPFQSQVTSLYAAAGYVAVGTHAGEVVILDSTSGKIHFSRLVAAGVVVVKHADDQRIIIGAEDSVLALDAVSGKPLWIYKGAAWPTDLSLLNDVVIVRTAESQFAGINIENGEVLWHHIGTSPRVFTTNDSLFFVEHNRVQEYPGRRPIVSNLEVLTELSDALLSKGDAHKAEDYLKLATGMDPHYPGLLAVQAKLEKRKNNGSGAAHALLAFAGSVGSQSKIGEQAIAELKQDHGLLWYQDVDTDLAGKPILIGDKLITGGRSVRSRSRLIAFDALTGETVWRQPVERVSDVAVDAVDAGNLRACYITTDPGDATIAVVYSLDIQRGERTEIARWRNPHAITLAAVAYAGGRLLAATTSADLFAMRLALKVNCFTRTGEKVWNKTHEWESSPAALARPLPVFEPNGAVLHYSVGDRICAVSIPTGKVIRRSRPAVENSDDASPPDPLRPVPSVLVSGETSYTFTPHRVAYAMRRQL